MRTRLSTRRATRFAAGIAVAIGGFAGTAALGDDEDSGSREEKSLSTLQFEFQVFVAELDKPLRELGNFYTARLRKVEANYLEDGNAVAAGIVRREIRSFESGDVVIPGALTEVRRLREIYDRERLPLIQDRTPKIAALFETYRQNLLALQAALVSRNEFADAKKVSAELETVDRKRARLLAAGNSGGRRSDPELRLSRVTGSPSSIQRDQ